jgi:murein DD-endopeptidase MepM/ murein hydrolase activator NlpD
MGCVRRILPTAAAIAFMSAAPALGYRGYTVGGGVQAPSASVAGGVEYGVEIREPHARPRHKATRKSSRSHRRRPRHARRPAKSSPQVTPQVVPQTTPSQPPSLPPGVPTPAQTATAGAVFPVAGPHSFGGPENRFGAPRHGYTHQGQDILAAEGLAVVAPLPGTIATASYQRAGAGYYAVEHGDDGLDFMFAHCAAGTLVVAEGQRVAAGQALCKIGQTGDATAPHLHFELWVGGWRAPGGYPIDPLPYLEAWDHAGPSG